ncbi:hypothetical protein ABI59_10650 [Acidobacteria bacterium Mor1]|nr:hypothetical protein ABI59_10650 [Acidobacteria bacterium Mor1]
MTDAWSRLMKRGVFVAVTGVLCALLAIANVHAQCEETVNLFATSVLDACGWDNEQQAIGNPNGDNDCDTNQGSFTPYAIQDFQARECGNGACTRDYACSCPGDGTGMGAPPDCRCLLKANDFQNFTLGSKKKIKRVEVDVQCRYNFSSAGPSCTSADTGEIRVRLRIPSIDSNIEQTIRSGVFTSTSGNCQYRLGGLGNITENNDFGLTAIPGTPGRRLWTEADVDDIRLAVGRLRDDDDTALRVNAFRIRVTTCDDNNTDGVCDDCIGACCTATCGFAAAGSVCRGAAAGGCDIAEVCSGSSAACPADGFRPPTYQCRSAAGDCDDPATCPGNGPLCPPNPYKPPTHVCREAAGVCDSPETCSGVGPFCPSDQLLGSTTVCRPSTADCDAEEVCSGQLSCPPDLPADDGTTCDDGLACTLIDTCEAGSCVGGTPTPPQEVKELRAESANGFVWNTLPGALYDALRGSLPGPVGTSGEICIGTSLAVAELDDFQVPAPGQGFFYLVRGTNECGAGTYGGDSAGIERVSAACNQ